LASKTRFHRNKSRYLVEANLKWNNVREKIKQTQNIIELRNWLAEEVLGLGLKEASHFLRNIGKSDNKVAILDRHILNLMVENNYLETKPKILSKKTYLEIESKFNELAKDIKMSPAELDLYMWYMKTGQVLK